MTKCAPIIEWVKKSEQIVPKHKMIDYYAGDIQEHVSNDSGACFIPVDNKSSLVQVMGCRISGDKSIICNACWPISSAHICVTRP